MDLYLEIERISMEKICSRKFMAMVLIMLVLSVTHADDSLDGPGSPLPLPLLSPPRRLLSLRPAHNDFLPGSVIRGISKIPGVPKLVAKITKSKLFTKAGVGNVATCAMTCHMFCPNNHGTITAACYAMCGKIACGH